MAAYKVKFDKKVASYKKMYAANEAELKPINDALAAKEYKKAFELMDKLVAEKPSRSNMINQMKFTALLKQGKDQEAIAFGNQWRKEDADAPISIFISTYDADNLSKATYLWTASLFEAAAPKMNPVLFHMLASIYAKGGDCQKAAVNEEKAVKGAKTALKKGEMMGTIMDYTVTEYKQVLARYKKAEKAAKNESKK
jgi:TPR repeat protein